MNNFIVIFLSISVQIVFTTALQCVDENNNPVDWYMAYKLPKIRGTGNRYVTDGIAYVYITSEDYSAWTLSKKSIHDPDSMVGKTISPLYSNNKDLLHLVYNDETPDGKVSSYRGHTKGVILSDSTSGLWLIHSAPQFPSLDTYSYPLTARVYGQSILCLSLDLDNLDDVGNQLKYNFPLYYSANIPNSLKDQVPNLAEAARNVSVRKAPFYRVTTLKTLEGVEFTSFAKAKKWGQELYEDLIAPTLESNLYVETWVKGTGRLPSNCTETYKVWSIKSVNINVADVTFPATKDHSKWAVSETDGNNHWICIGDINRMKSQEARGGGSVCLNSKAVSENYQNSVADVLPCPKSNSLEKIDQEGKQEKLQEFIDEISAYIV